MKYTKSAFPYLALLFIVLIGFPLINYQAQKTQQLIVKVEVKEQNNINQKMASFKEDSSNKEVLVMISK